MMKTTKTPIRLNKSLAMIIPDWIVKGKDITEKSRLVIEQSSYGFKVRVKG